MASNIETFSIRIENSVISDFRNQARAEHITQGKLFEKVLNLYLERSKFRLAYIYFASTISRTSI